MRSWHGPGYGSTGPDEDFYEDELRDLASAASNAHVLQLLRDWRKHSNAMARLGVAHCLGWFDDAGTSETWEFVVNDKILSTNRQSICKVGILVRDHPRAIVTLQFWREKRPDDVIRDAIGGLANDEATILARVGDVVEVAIAGTNGGANAAWRLEGETVCALSAADRSVAIDLFAPGDS